MNSARFRPREVNFLLASSELPDQFVREPMHGLRHAKRLLEDDLVVVRNVRVEDGVRRSTRERKNALVVIASDDEVVCPLAPFPNQRQLHPVQVLRLVRENHRRIGGRHRDIAETLLDEIGEIQKT